VGSFLVEFISTDTSTRPSPWWLLPLSQVNELTYFRGYGEGEKSTWCGEGTNNSNRKGGVSLNQQSMYTVD
jgi:hypothetical protein